MKSFSLYYPKIVSLLLEVSVSLIGLLYFIKTRINLLNGAKLGLIIQYKVMQQKQQKRWETLKLLLSVNSKVCKLAYVSNSFPFFLERSWKQLV